MKPPYPLPPTSTVSEIVEVLKLLKADAEREREKSATQAFFTKEEQFIQQAYGFDGKREMLSSLIWALGGTAENDGCKPTVDIY